MKRAPLIALVVFVAAAGGAGAYWYNGYQETLARHAAARAGMPARPSLASWPAELQQRIQSAEQAVRSGHEPAEGLALLARLYHANGFEPEAVTAYKALVNADPRNGRWPHNLAHILSTYGRSEDAVMLWERVVLLAPDYIPARIRLGDALLKLNRLDEADRVYAAGAGVAPDNPYLLVGQARVAMARKQWETAKTRLESAVDKSQFRIGNDLLVTVYEQMGLTAQALEVRGKAKSFGSFYDAPDPWFDDIYEDCYDPYRLAMGSGLADRRGDQAAAVRLLERIIRINPGYSLAYFHLGKLQVRQGLKTQAEQTLRKAIDLDPSYGDSWLALYELLKESNRTAALALLREGLQRCPTSPGMHLEYGRLLRDAGKIDSALREFAIVVDLRPAEVEAVIEIAKIHFNQDRIPEGLAEMTRVLDVIPGHPVALTTLAFFWIETGDQAKARDWLRQCRDQPRIPRTDVTTLGQRFQAKFGQSPW